MALDMALKCYTSVARGQTKSQEFFGANSYACRNRVKRHFCLSFLILYLFIRSCKFVIIETRAYDITHDENAMTSLISQPI